MIKEYNIFFLELSNISVRLINGTHTYEGSVQVLYNGTWGLICDNGWSDAEAQVVCSMLGYDRLMDFLITCDMLVMLKKFKPGFLFLNTLNLKKNHRLWKNVRFLILTCDKKNIYKIQHCILLSM